MGCFFICGIFKTAVNSLTSESSGGWSLWLFPMRTGLWPILPRVWRQMIPAAKVIKGHATSTFFTGMVVPRTLSCPARLLRTKRLSLTSLIYMGQPTTFVSNSQGKQQPAVWINLYIRAWLALERAVSHTSGSDRISITSNSAVRAQKQPYMKSTWMVVVG